MEALHFGEGNNHPNRPPAPAVHTDAREAMIAIRSGPHTYNSSI